MRLTYFFISMMAFAGLSYFFFISDVEAQNPEEQQGPMPVVATEVGAETTQIWKPFSGRAEAVNFAEIRPQVSGTITKIAFADGDVVEKDALLFVIDPRPYEAQLKIAKAELASANNQASLAKKELDRSKELVKTDAISERVNDQRQNDLQVAYANVARAKAMVEQAEINLDYTSIKAPFDGKLSRAEILMGNLVETGSNAPILTTIVSDEGIYVDFEVDDTAYFEIIRKARSSNTPLTDIPVRVYVPGQDTPLLGNVQSFDNRLDVTSGTIRARAIFDNTEQLLLPGMFVTVEMGMPTENTYIMVQERAIGTNQDRKFVYVINEQGMAEYRAVTLGEKVDAKRVVKNGLEEGETIITEGILKIQPGMPVQAKTPEQMQQQNQQQP